MKILVLGGTGFISGALVKTLLKEGEEVTTLTRGITGKEGIQDPKLRRITGDRSDENLLNELAVQNFDAVYDMIAYTPDESRQMIKAFKGKTGRFIHMSTISVYMVSHELVTPVTEDQDKKKEMEFWGNNPFGMTYGLEKRKCEDVLWAAHDDSIFPVTMARAPYVCGPRDPVKRDFFWIERILDGKPLLVPGSGDNAFQVVYVDDLAEGLKKMLYSPEAPGKAYNIAADEFYSLNEYLARLASLMNKNPELISVDQEIFDKLSFSRHPNGDVFPFNTRRTAVFSIARAKKDLGFKSTPFETWMEKTIKWYLNEYKGHSTGWENRGAELKFAEHWKRKKEEFLNNIELI